jgi:tetratricopeptide (TPR) repeat protein
VQPASRPLPRDNAEARRLAAQGREAALVGDRTEARDAFRRAAALNPGDEQIAYDLARANEELADTAAAITEYCRYLALSPNGRQSADVQARVLRLSPAGTADAARRAEQRFAAGLAAYDRGRAADAMAAFDEVLRTAPSASEALFGRALARIALGRRSEAARDLEAYLAVSQAPEERTSVLRAIEALRRPTFEPGRAFVRGLSAPGLGQFYTNRPALGVGVLGAVAGAVGGVLYQRTVTSERTFTDPFGNPYTQPVTKRERPYAVVSGAAVAAVWLAAAFEARHHAAGGQRVAAPPPAPGRTSRLELAPVVGRASLGLAGRARF